MFLCTVPGNVFPWAFEFASCKRHWFCRNLNVSWSSVGLGGARLMERNRVLETYLLCACDRFRSVDGYGLRLYSFGGKGTRSSWWRGFAFQVFCLGMCFLNVCKLWSSKRLARAGLPDTNWWVQVLLSPARGGRSPAVLRSRVLAGRGTGTGCNDPRLAHFVSWPLTVLMTWEPSVHSVSAWAVYFSKLGDSWARGGEGQPWASQLPGNGRS